VALDAKNGILINLQAALKAGAYSLGGDVELEEVDYES
jgi:hypothetical protein